MLKQLELDSDNLLTEVSARQNNEPPEQKNSRYSALLEGPISSIVCNVPDRPDVQTIAILGYN
ncbi:hypothetical protein E2553_38480 [Paraburkholderia dipogonis]|uniref:Uncharacterized protein n=1 Tax=Paraburkholderia dipogonis TaxID=1211383 RepID=A0A4Y8MIS9_9BURK|nr:hypothetical protein [Paraburkholderia dipogonis]TFE37376.1 hypothetical protein E2553_38480 [Paraburkholderia dipogonis]